MITEYIKIKDFRDTLYLNDDDLKEFDFNKLNAYVENRGYSERVYFLELSWNDLNNEFRTRSIKIPNKIKKGIINGDGILKSWFIQRLNTFKENQSINYINLFKKLNLSSGMVYFTSYGFGYCLIGGLYMGEKFKKEIEGIKKFLDDLKIIYKTETSAGGWVYRFKISQSKENINLIKEVLK